MKLPKIILLILVFALSFCMFSCAEEPHTHAYGTWQTVTAPTCEAQGEQSRSCACGDTQTAPLPTVAHTFLDGACLVCGEKDSAHTHAYGAWQTVTAPTCKTQGKKMRTCACGASEEEILPFATHTYEDGVCTSCGEEEAVHTHAYTPKVTKEPTCKQTGVTTYRCTCGDSYTVSLPIEAHVYVDGSCKWCGKTELHLHSYGKWVTTKEATCLAEGVKTRSCSCGATQTKAVPIIDHAYVGGICTMCKQQDPDAFVPDDSAGTVNTVGNIYGTSYGTYYAAQGDMLYFAKDFTEIVKCKLSSSQLVTVYTPSYGYVRCINVVGDWIYFAVEDEEDADCYMARVRTDGSSFETLVSAVRIEELLVVGDTVFYTTVKNPYTNYTTDCAPMYRMSTSGEGIKMIYNGYVSSMVSDGTYVYFRHTPKSGKSSIMRIKCDGTKPTALYTNTDVNYIFLANARLYFLIYDEDMGESTIASVSTGGGSYTTYGRIPYYTDWLYVYDGSIYYHGSPYVEGGFSESYGLIEYNTATKVYREVQTSFDLYSITHGYILTEARDEDWQATTVYVYSLKSKTWKTVALP